MKLLQGFIQPLAIALLCAISCSAKAYEITTHAFLTYAAYSRSVVDAEHELLVQALLGFDRLSYPIPFGESYFDNVPNDSNPSFFRRVKSLEELFVFEKLYKSGRFGTANNVEDLLFTAQGWLMVGVIREDDNEVLYPGGFLWYKAGEFDNDPWGHLFRAPGHFYDPIKDRAFSFRDACEDYECIKSIKWALGTTDPLDPLTEAEDSTRRNHFTWSDALRNYWLALTLRRDYDAAGYGSNMDRLLSSGERLDRWATTIKSLGHVIHLVQDAAQPQHTRNDTHAPPAVAFGPDNDSNGAYEYYTDFRVVRQPELFDDATNNPLREMDEGIPDIRALPQPHLGNYPTVSFATPVRYFTTRHINTGTDAGSVNARRGMADFSNRNFFTRGSLPGFSECSPPGTDCVPGPNPTYVLPENDLDDVSVYAEYVVPGDIRIDGEPVSMTEFARQATDAVSPGYQDHLDPVYQGKVPLVSRGIFADDPNAPATVRAVMRYNNFSADADVLLPRAVAYSTGLINHFFRGRLEVLPPADRVVAVLNQGVPHVMNAFGYPCAGTTASDGCALFGFEKVRIAVRNATPAIVESGTGQVVPQNTGGVGAQLVAIARYHRNSCYKPDLSGERVQSYAPPPALVIAEPACASGLAVRTDPIEIAVSQPLTVAAGELDNLAAGSGVEKLFDFSADPIPVNATDLFIQVAYRGPMGDAALGLDRDVIAVGMLDVREPTFASFWNNTDYFWNGAAWLARNGTYPNQGIRDFSVCAGGFPVKLVYQYQGALGTPAMIDPVSGGNAPGQVRLGFVFPPPDAGFPAQRKSIRGTPATFGNPRVPVRTATSSGHYRQANKETVTPATLAAPVLNCGTQLPGAAEYWCSDPIQRRRSERFGTVAQPLYLEQVPGSGATDVDAAPLPAFSGSVTLAAGTLRFNADAVLANCPAQPALSLEAREHLRRIELDEEAAASGLSVQ